MLTLLCNLSAGKKTPDIVLSNQANLYQQLAAKGIVLVSVFEKNQFWSAKADFLENKGKRG